MSNENKITFKAMMEAPIVNNEAKYILHQPEGMSDEEFEKMADQFVKELKGET